MELNQVYDIDCIQGMKQLEAESIDMILCDLDYPGKIRQATPGTASNTEAGGSSEVADPDIHRRGRPGAG